MKNKLLISMVLATLAVTNVYAETNIQQCYDLSSKVKSIKAKKLSYEKRIEEIDEDLQKRDEDLDSQKMWITTKKSVIDGIGASREFIDEYNRSVDRYRIQVNAYNKLIDKKESLIEKYNDFVDDAQSDFEKYRDCSDQKYSRDEIKSVCPKDSQNDFCLGFDLKKIYVCSIFDKNCKPEDMGNIWEK